MREHDWSDRGQHCCCLDEEMPELVKSEARVADLERTAQAAEDMRDASDARVRELEAVLARIVDVDARTTKDGTARSAALTMAANMAEAAIRPSPADSVSEASGTMQCPICGASEPHAHGREHVEQWATHQVARWGYKARLLPASGPDPIDELTARVSRVIAGLGEAQDDWIASYGWPRTEIEDIKDVFRLLAEGRSAMPTSECTGRLAHLCTRCMRQIGEHVIQPGDAPPACPDDEATPTGSEAR